MAEVIVQLCAACCCMSCCVLLILIILSFSSLDVNQIGLDYSGISKTISKTPYTAGIHFLGIGHHFLKFQKTIQTLEFSEEKKADSGSLKSRTLDGLEVVLEISFQFRLQSDQLYNLYFTFKDNYRSIFLEMAINVLTEQATQYTAYDFFVDRQAIGQQMQVNLNSYFKKNCFANIEFFQLRSVDLPNEFEGAIQESEVKKQSIQKAYAQKNQQVVQLETQLKTAEYQKNVTINLASGDAQQIELDGQAKATSFLIRQDTNAQSFDKLRRELGLNSTQLIQYLKSKIIRDYGGKNLVINLRQFNGDL